MQPDSITHILKEIQQGSHEAAEKLYAEYQSLVIRVVRRHLSREMRRLADSIDFSQIVWKTIFDNVTHLNTLNNPEAVGAYIAQIAANKVHTEVRSQLAQKRDIRRSKGAAEAEADQLPTRDPTPSQSAMAHERLAAICSELTPVQQQMVYQRLDGYNIEEIAKNLQLNERTVRRVLKRLTDSQE